MQIKLGTFFSFITCLLLGMFVVMFIRGCVTADYTYEKEIGSYWDLADKSSTLSEKSEYISLMVQRLERSKHGNSSAIWLVTPNNTFDYNLKALKSLDTRLKEIQKIDPKSFEYQTAIQQITAQEQGEASAMLFVFRECWLIGNGYWYLFSWIGTLIGLILLIAFVITLVIFLYNIVEG